MKNSLCDLNNILFECLEKLNDDSGDIDIEKEIGRTKAIVEVSNTMIDVARTQLDSIKYFDSLNYKDDEIPDLLKNKDKLKNAKAIGTRHA